VYLNYGVHDLFNVVTEAAGSPAAVLIRALEPLDGIALMQRRRSPGRLGPVPVHELCRGPGNLTKAMGITLADNRADLCGDGLFVEDRGVHVSAVKWSPRIGIRVGTEHAWRCYLAGSRAVSGRVTR
jgi:DNA-3-methyladenine glycosylase